MPYPGRQNIYEATIRRLVTMALDAQEEAFEREHGADGDEVLLAYLVACARQLGHSPRPREIVGGRLIEGRFGDWDRALTRAELPAPCVPDKYQSFARVREEIKRQKHLYHQRRREKCARQEAGDDHRFWNADPYGTADGVDAKQIVDYDKKVVSGFPAYMAGGEE